MKTHILSALVIFQFGFGLSAFGANQDETLSGKDLQNLQGTWTVVSSEQNGEKRRDLEEVKKMRLKIEGDKWTLDDNNKTKDQTVAIMKLNPTVKPKAVDFSVIVGLATGETLPAIYEIKGNDLKFCFPDESKQRPKNFSSTEGPGGRLLLILKREK
jgi:uncharacterized protein (TIGR03067 family)